MTLLITIAAALAATLVWYFREDRKELRLGVLCLTYWGASLMWTVDFIAEYSELRADYFIQEFADILNDALLGVTVVALGLVIWLVALFIKDPKGVFGRMFASKAKK